MNDDILQQIDDVSKQCDNLLEEVRFEILDPNDALNKLTEIYRSISNEEQYDR